jgi:hypothetical protein
MIKGHAVFSVVLAALLSACAGAPPQQSVEGAPPQQSAAGAPHQQSVEEVDSRSKGPACVRECFGRIKICYDTCPSP